MVTGADIQQPITGGNASQGAGDARPLFRPLAEDALRRENGFMAKSRKSSIGWGACKAAMRDWPRPGVLALVKELYDLSDENRRFLHARLLPDQSEQTLDQTKQKLKRMLSVEAVFGDRFQHGQIKRLIDQYAKATDDPGALADLLITDLEAGFATFSQVGDFEPMVDHLYATLERLDKCLETLPRETLTVLVPRLTDLAAKWGAEFGYGISDELSGFAADWDERVRGS
jgi:hypothetical protein